MKILYYTAPCGAGKSYQAAQNMIATPGRYIVVRDRVEAIGEYQRDLMAMAARGGRSILITSITNRRGRSVRMDVENIPNEFDSHPHVIVMITHKAMHLADFSSFTGWHIIIDETPAVLDRQELQTAKSRAFFETNYRLAPLNDHWSSVTLSREGWNITPADLERDDCMNVLRQWHERVTAATPLPDDASLAMARRSHAHDASRRAVVSNLKTWRDMDDGRQWTWWSLWSPRQLEAFASVLIMANAFDHSMTFKLLKNLNPSIEWIPVPLASTRKFAPRTVRIEYFAQNHIASRCLFDSPDGKANLDAIARHLAHRDQIWMTNERYEDSLTGMGGQRLSPLQAGSNEWAGIHAATAIYSAKPSEEARAVLDLLGVDPGSWTHSNEYETILQFMTRTSIRDPHSTATVTMAVYDHQQAAYLAQYLADQPHITVEVQHIDLDLIDRERKRGRPRLVLSVEEADAKAMARREQRAEAQRARREKARKAA